MWGLVAREDLTRASAALRLRFPVYALIGGVESLPGGATFFERLGAKRGRSGSQGLPAQPGRRTRGHRCRSGEGNDVGVRRLAVVLRLKQMRADSAAETRENAGCSVSCRASPSCPRLARLVSRAVAHPDVAPVFGGCYLAVTTPADPNDVKFAKEFLQEDREFAGGRGLDRGGLATTRSYRSMARTGMPVGANASRGHRRLGATSATFILSRSGETAGRTQPLLRLVTAESCSSDRWLGGLLHLDLNRATPRHPCWSPS